MAGPVPYAGCSACCHYEGISIDEKRDRSRLPHLLTERDHDRELVLQRRADGACAHLGDRGCMIYEHRPSACRAKPKAVIGRTLSGIVVQDKCLTKSIMASLTSAARSCWIQWPHPCRMIVRRSSGTNFAMLGMRSRIPGKSSTTSRSPAM
jgi:Fe-S-cluster containining protein